jgi:predicted secreted protein
MRYLVTARVRPGKEAALLQAIENGNALQIKAAQEFYLRLSENPGAARSGS